LEIQDTVTRRQPQVEQAATETSRAVGHLDERSLSSWFLEGDGRAMPLRRSSDEDAEIHAAP
jgi:hypothetical protein